MEPLASRMRPKNLDEFVGQEHLTGKDKPLAVAISKKHLFSFILWGPPGSGKTTLARIYARSLGAEFFELSAVSAGKDDIRKIVEKRMVLSLLTKGVAESARTGVVTTLPTSEGGTPFSKGESKPKKVLFLDEIHRFNKAQQDFLLPLVESGEVTLVGATTENPSFEVISPLLSRCRVFVLESLSEADMEKIIGRTGLKLKKDAREWLVNMANGDARQAITLLEATEKLYGKITLENLKNAFQSKFLRYDKKGEEHYNIISAFIKSMRASQSDAALYYLARMIESGEDPKFIARRMVVFASEDIGLAQPTALVVANAVFAAVDTIGLPECAENLAHGVAYLSQAKKDRSAYDAYMAALADTKQYGNLPIPLKIRNAPTKLMKNLGYGAGYEKYSKDDLLPEKLRGKKYLKERKEDK